MNDPCGRIDERLDAWIDGTCEPAERERVERHLAACPDCRRRADEIRAVVDAARDLPRELDLPRDLRPGIRAAARRRAPLRPALVGLAAAAVLALAGVSAWWLRPTALPAPAPAAAATAAARPDAAFRRAAAELASAAAGLESSLRNDAHLAPQTRTVLDENLRILDEAIAEASRALDVRPSDPARGRTLTALYRRKVDVLWRVSRLAERRASGGTHDA